MNSRIRAKLLPLAIASLLAAPAFAQDTSSAISGRVLDASGQPVANADVKLVHEPSGTTKIVQTDAEGRYSAQGLRVGGPFDVVVSKGGQPVVEQDNVFLALGQVTAVNLSAAPAAAATSAQSLEGVSVTATSVNQTFTPDNKGLSTNISRKELETIPTPGRSIQNVVRMDPRVVITDRARGEISAVGQNSRYNNITVDSVSANDPFGLNANGLPTLGTPISQDAIESYQISTANYDVATRRGVGANINAVTKSGTNDFHGSVYYAFQNKDMIGDNEIGKEYAGFDRQFTAGGTLGGPIIKDKLFFFGLVEKSKQIGSGSPYGPSDSGAATPIANLTNAQLQQVRNFATQLGLGDIGSVGGGNSNLEDKRYLGKLDWNITDNHRASFTFSQTKENKPVITGSSTKLVLSSGWYKTAADNKSYALHFYDDWSDIFSTDTTVSYAKFHQDRSPYTGVDMPDITVYPTTFANGGGVEFGTEYSSQANVLDVKSWNAAWAGSLYLGDHTLKGGFDYEKDTYYNLFLQGAFGSYTFEELPAGVGANNGLANFANGRYWKYSYNRPANGLGLNDVAAAYSLQQWGVFLQDTWQATPNLSVQYGFRVDIPLMSDKPLYNARYAAAYGQTNQYTLDGHRVVQPRLSFNYMFDTEHMTQLRGGAGLFVTNQPAVWLGNIFSNSGVTQTQFTCGPTNGGSGSCTGANIPAFSANPARQNDGVVGSGQQTVNVITKDWNIPTAWKLSLGFDKELPWWGLVASVDYEHIDQRDAIYFKNLNLGTPRTGPDGRNLYWTSFGDPAKDRTVQARRLANSGFSGNTIELGNTSKGKAESLAMTLKKNFSDDWSAMVGFTWSRSTEVNPGTSSVASSNYNNNYVYNANEDKASTSNYSVPRRVIAALTWQHAFFGDYKTTASMFYDGHSAYPYTWSFGNDANGDGITNNDVAFIPRQGQVEFTPGTSQALINSFYDYIQHNDYLKDHQGQPAQRNGDRAGWINQVDLSFQQEIPGLFGKDRGVVKLDIYNFGNLLNKHWGIEKRVNFPGGRGLADYAGVDQATGKYIYNITGSKYSNGNSYQPLAIPTYINNNDDLAQRWSVLLTVKYTF
ncbi:carboxypeptidase regulatory-like domain-containing protein [Luteibacter sp. PPL201]|uniref:Carboxypeptidase regulatory-like domain-containing protein n=1 Tax=Luteibacter sahnii TaxID=3021977 RepID=A0ABT6B792_9GAMM